MVQSQLQSRSVGLFVDGSWEEGSAEQSIEATSPVTGEAIGIVVQGGREDARRAIAAAREAFPAWAGRTAFERAEALHRLADVCRSRRDELARTLTLDQGKPLHTEAYAEVDDLIAYWGMAAEDAIRLEGVLAPSRTPGTRALLVRRALGPVAVITPWNWPYTMPAQVIAPALAVGNTVVWTPAPSTSVCSGLLMECIAEADLPSGTCNFVPGPGPEVGDEIAGHRDIAAVAFVGSTATGRSVAARSAGKTQILELGNNGPIVVMDDADLDAATEGILAGAFLCGGQSCAAAERILVHELVHDALVERLLPAIEAEVRIGDPFDQSTTMGPLNNTGVADKMDSHVADAVSRGAKVLAGGGREPGFPTDLYWQATVLDAVPPDALAAREETFGPIAPLVAIDSLEMAMDVTNSLDYGLLAAIYTRDLSQGLRFADGVRCGIVNVNESSNYWEIQLPFGGRAGSSSGTGRVGGRFAAEQLTELQTVILSPSRS
jgi:succinate-semialdehyde dehydrogenase/glutarate-semialdehyde dehydrogenase